MNPNDIQLNSASRNFDYEVKSREIDACNDINTLRDIAKSFIKLYLKQQETLKVIST